MPANLAGIAKSFLSGIFDFSDYRVVWLSIKPLDIEFLPGFAQS
jgi:hypothetical protein